MNPIQKASYRILKGQKKSVYLKYLTGRFPCLSTGRIRQICYSFLVNALSDKQVFTLVYEQNLWNDPESVSGPGSTFEITKNIRASLPELFKTYHIKSMLDIPCGDFNWMQFVEMNGIEYIGADIVEELIEKNHRQFATERRSFRMLDLVKDPLPKVDLVLCRDGLVHLSDKQIKQALKNIKKSGSTYLLATNFTEKEFNMKIGTTRWRPLNFGISPFNFPKPFMIIRENVEVESFRDKSLCLWAIKDL